MSDSKKKVCLNSSEEQLFAIEAFFAHSNWDFDQSVVFNEWREEVTGDINFAEAATNDSISDSEHETQNETHAPVDRVQQRLNFGANDIDNSIECDKCSCTPCVTFHPQKWLGNGCAPNIWNASIRKTKYKKYWTMLSRRDVWKNSKYLDKKIRAFSESDTDGIVWTNREIMPDCVTSLVRSRYPNPPGRPYMGHKWV